MSLPALTLTGNPYEQGLGHGKELKDSIRHNIKLYHERFRLEGKLAKEDVILRAEKYLKVIEGQNADYFDAMLGIAEGSGSELLDIAALNVRYEILYHQLTALAMADACTAFALMPAITENRHLLMGQNWDWIPRVKGAVIRTTEIDGLETLSFTEAGIVGGKIGLNSSGLGLAVNGLNTTDDDWSRLGKPFHVRCYEILRSRDVETASQAVAGTKRSCSANFLIAQAQDKAVDLEAAPNKVHFLTWDKDSIVHANHFVEPNAIGVVEPPNERRIHSYRRQEQFRRLLDAKRPVGIEDLKAYLRDHEGFPDSVCRHSNPDEPGQERCITVASIIMDLNTMTMHVTDGQPCETDYQPVFLR